MTLVDGENTGNKAKLPAIPLEMSGRRFGVRHDLPRQGEHSRLVAADIGVLEAECMQLIEQGVIRAE